MVQISLEHWQIPIKLKIYISYDLDMPHLATYPRDMKMYVHKKTYTRMYTVALFTIAPSWKNLKCPSAGEWIDKL